MRNRLPLILFVLVLFASVLGGLVGGRVRAGSSMREAEELILKFSEVLALIESSHVREVSPETLVENAIQGLLRTLDPHSTFLQRLTTAAFRKSNVGDTTGLESRSGRKHPGAAACWS